MKKVKVFFLSIVCTLLLLAVVSCNNSNNNQEPSNDTPITPTEKGTCTINVYDIDGSVIDNAVCDIANYENLYQALDVNFEVTDYDSDYGKVVTSINKSVVDPNYYVAIYENGALAQTGAEGVKLKDKAVYDFKVECWNTKSSGYGTMDDYDVLVDKAIYKYAKTYMKEELASFSKYDSSSYWTFMSILMMKKNNYDVNVFNTSSVTSAALTANANVDPSDLAAAKLMKYYYYTKAVGNDITLAKDALSNYVSETLSSTYNPYDEYTLPFVMAACKNANVTSNKLTTLANTEYRAGTEYGIDGLAWEIAANAAYGAYTTNDVLEAFELKDQGNAASTALILLPYAAMGVSPRTANADLIKIIFDNYYDETLGLVKYASTDTGVNFSTNQIYASLMAYKVARDTNAKAYFFS